jgi:two-component system, LytTR family, sensor kinase
MEHEEESAGRPRRRHDSSSRTAWLADPDRRYWLAVGAIGWLAVGVISFTDMTMQQALAGHSITWANLVPVLAWLLPGAALSPLVLWLFRALSGSGVRGLHPAAYLLVGVMFWLSWATGHAVVQYLLGASPAPTLGATIHTALPAHLFTSVIMFTVIAVLYQFTVRRQEARDRELRAARLRSEVARARTAALSAQLNPHFLFNTLHVASGLMEVQPAGAKRILDDLRGLMDQALRHNEAALVPLADELELVHRYLRIQRARFGDQLDVAVRVTEEALTCLVPPLVLQPLVENAVQHGIARGSGSGSIVLEARRLDGRLRIEVVDTGAKRSDSRSSKASGLGLAGVRARLELLFGEKCRLTAVPIPSGGFHATAELPAMESLQPTNAHG